MIHVFPNTCNGNHVGPKLGPIMGPCGAQAWAPHGPYIYTYTSLYLYISLYIYVYIHTLYI